MAVKVKAEAYEGPDPRYLKIPDASSETFFTDDNVGVILISSQVLTSQVGVTSKPGNKAAVGLLQAETAYEGVNGEIRSRLFVGEEKALTSADAPYPHTAHDVLRLVMHVDGPRPKSLENPSSRCQLTKKKLG